MRAAITILALLLSLIGACDAGAPRRELPRVEEAPKAAAPTPLPLTPPAVTHRIAKGRGPERLADFGLSVAIRVPAGAELEWMDGSLDVMLDHKIGTVRVIDDLDPDQGLLRERGLRLYVRGPVDGEVTELPKFEENLRAEPARLAAEVDAMKRDLEEIDREMRAAGIPRPAEDDEDDELADELIDTPARLEIVHRRATQTGWELVWTFDDVAFEVRVWRADLGVFCMDLLATRPAALRTLDVCRTLAPG